MSQRKYGLKMGGVEFATDFKQTLVDLQRSLQKSAMDFKVHLGRLQSEVGATSPIFYF